MSLHNETQRAIFANGYTSAYAPPRCGENGGQAILAQIEFISFILGDENHPYTHLIIRTDFVTEELIDACTARGVVITPIDPKMLHEEDPLQTNFFLHRSEMMSRLRFTTLAEAEYKEQLRGIARSNTAKGVG